VALHVRSLTELPTELGEDSSLVLRYMFLYNIQNYFDTSLLNIQEDMNINLFTLMVEKFIQCTILNGRQLNTEVYNEEIII
jgi:hypothetical protein